MSPSGRWFAAGEEAVYRYRQGQASQPGPLAKRSGEVVRVLGILEGHPDTPGFRRPYYQVEFKDGTVIVASQSELRRRNPPAGSRKHPKALQDALYGLMMEAFDCGPIDGGCVTTARGLCSALGGEMWTLVGRPARHAAASPQHALCKVGDRFWDGEGVWSERGILQHWGDLEDMQDGHLRPWREGDLEGEAPDDPAVAAKVAALFTKRRNPAGPFWDDLSEEEREGHHRRVDAELRALGALSYPRKALWGPAGEVVEVLGPARRFPPYNASPGGPEAYRSDFQMLATRPDGSRAVLMAHHLRDPATRAPWLTPSPGRRDPRGPLERFLERQGNPEGGSPAVRAFWADVVAEAPSVEDWARGVDVLGFEDDVTVNLEQAEFSDAPEVWIQMVETAEEGRGRGKASRALRWLSSLADRHGITLLLVPDAQDEAGLSTEALEAWYGRHGFKEHWWGETDVMRRLPRQGNPTLRLGGKMRSIPLDEDLREDLSSVLRIHSYPPTPAMLAFWADYRAGTKELHKGTGWSHSLHGDQVVLDLRMDPTQGTIHIIEIKAIDKRVGAGTAALEFLTRLADKHGVTLTLVAQRLGTDGMRQGDLVRWYRRHGFQRRGSRGWDMRRKPR